MAWNVHSLQLLVVCGSTVFWPMQDEACAKHISHNSMIRSKLPAQFKLYVNPHRRQQVVVLKPTFRQAQT